MRLRTQILFLMILVMGVHFSPSNTIAQNDANSGTDAPDTSINALPISFDTTYTGLVGSSYANTNGSSDYHDYYQLSVTGSGNLTVTYEIVSINSSLSTVSILRNGLVSGIETFFQDETPFTLIVPVPSSAAYTIEINSYSNDVSYRFLAHFTSGTIPGQSDGGSAGDTGILSPKTVQLDTTYSGAIGNNRIDSLGYLDSSDYYSVSLPASGYLTLNVIESSNSTLNSLLIAIETSNLDTIISGSVSFITSDYTGSAPIYGIGNYIIDFSTFDWNATYQFSLTFQPGSIPMQHDTGANGDAPSDRTSAPLVGVNTTFSGTVGETLLDSSTHARDDDDYFALGSLGYGNLTVNITFNGSIDSYASVYASVKQNGSLSSVFSIYSSSLTTFKEESMIISSGMNYIDVWSLDTNVTYSVSVMFETLPEPISSTTSTTSTTTTTTSNLISSSQTSSSVNPASTRQSSSEPISDAGSAPLSIDFVCLALVLIPYKRKLLSKK